MTNFVCKVKTGWRTSLLLRVTLQIMRLDNVSNLGSGLDLAVSTFNKQSFCNLWIYGLSGIRELHWNYWFQKADCHFPAISESVGTSPEGKRKGMETPARCLNKAEQTRMSTEKCEWAQDSLYLEHMFLWLSKVLILSMTCEAICTICPALNASRPIQVSESGTLKGHTSAVLLTTQFFFKLSKISKSYHTWAKFLTGAEMGYNGTIILHGGSE